MLDFGIEIYSVLILCGVAFAAGFIDAVAGGGGLLTVPALLTVGLPPHLALGTNKLAASFGSFIASLTYFKKKLFNPVFWRDSIIATAVGSVIGTVIVTYLSGDFLEKWLPVLIAITAVYTLVSKPKPDSQLTLPAVTTKFKVIRAIQGFVLGFYDGFAGPGAGAFWTVSTMAIYKMNLLLSCGLARTMNFVSNFSSLIAFMVLGHINYMLGICMGLCLMVGAYIGAHSAIKFGSRFIRPVFITVVLGIAAQLTYKAWF
ncbi:MAG: putative membrane protein YfcA [Phenylobacterium sp.]|jgi:uncharacterized membrane protein YfcA